MLIQILHTNQFPIRVVSKNQPNPNQIQRLIHHFRTSNTSSKPSIQSQFQRKERSASSETKSRRNRIRLNGAFPSSFKCRPIPPYPQFSSKTLDPKIFPTKDLPFPPKFPKSIETLVFLHEKGAPPRFSLEDRK